MARNTVGKLAKPAPGHRRRGRPCSRDRRHCCPANADCKPPLHGSVSQRVVRVRAGPDLDSDRRQAAQGSGGGKSGVGSASSNGSEKPQPSNETRSSQGSPSESHTLGGCLRKAVGNVWCAMTQALSGLQQSSQTAEQAPSSNGSGRTQATEARRDESSTSVTADAPDGSRETTATAAEGDAAPAQLKEGQVLMTTHRSIHEISREEWDACARSDAEECPFLLWDFFAALEDSGSTCAESGWLPWHVALRDANGMLLAVVPMFLKSHSMGEYVFDHSWANLHAQLGRQYYPKLQSSVPFTPVTGPRILLNPTVDRTAIRATVLSALWSVLDNMKVSSLHMTFNTAEESAAAARLGFLSRIGLQYHWENADYGCFDDFLGTLKQSKRKSIRQERKSMDKQGLRIRRLTGAALTPEIWDTFYEFYRNTTDRKWGSAYLTHDFFVRLGNTMADEVLLVVAYDDNKDGELVAAALNLVGSDALFGRNWGCRYPYAYKNLHFELCYYQAIDAAIEMGLKRVEAGAQGEHKIARGYLPTTTYSSHAVCDPTAAGYIRQFLRREQIEMNFTIDALNANASPYKDTTSTNNLQRAIAELRTHAEETAAQTPADKAT